MDENNKLREELQGLKRERCQIELAKKILNVADAPRNVSFFKSGDK